MKRSTALALLAILLLAVVLRLLPVLRQPYWGSDFGDYFSLTRGTVEQGTVPTSYGGWGITYPYFPGFFVLNGAFVLSGASIDFALAFLSPVIGAFAVLPLFLVAVRVTGDEISALASALFLAVIMLHVYATSHPTPATVGDLLLVGAFLMYLGMRRSPRLIVLAVPTALALLTTHHLATYALILAVAGSLLLRGVLDSKITLRSVRYEFAFLAVVVSATIVYWMTYGSKLWELLLASTPFSSGLLLGLAVLGIVSVAAGILARARVSWRFRPKVRSRRAAAIGAGIAVVTGLGILVAAILGPVAGTSIRLTPLHVVVFAPTVGFVALAAAGRRWMDWSREGVDVTGWFLVLLASIIVGGSLAATVLIPYRHLEYVAIPLSVMVGAGARWLTMGPDLSAAKRLVAVAAVGILVASSATVSVPPPAVMVGFDEGTDARSATGVLWVRENARGVVAGDHRLSSVLFGFAGVDATWDRETRFWHEENVTSAVDAMRAVDIMGQTRSIDWVVVDGNMRRGLQTSPFEPALPLLPSEEAKFMGPPFHKVYDSGYAQVYFVNWGLA